MKKIFLMFSTGLFLFSSCGIYNSYKPTETVDDNLYGNIISDDSLGIASVDWQYFFRDEYLKDIIGKALDNNNDLKAAQLRVKSAEASLLAANLSFLPGLSIAPQGSLSSFDHSSVNKSYTLPATANWQIDAFGSLLNAKRETKMGLFQTQAYEQAVRSQLIAAVANYYYTLLMLDEQLGITEQTSIKWKETVRVAKALKAAGQYTEAGVAQTEAAYYDICRSVEDLKLSIIKAENGLSLLISDTPQSFERGSLSIQDFPAEISIGIPLSLLRNRPDVIASEYALASSFYGVSKARSAFYPLINLNGTIGWTNSLGQIVVNPGKLIESAVGTITQPLFNKGRNIANLKIAKNQYEINNLSFQQTLLKAGSEVNDAVSSLQTAKNKREYIDKQILSLEKAVKSTKLLMQNGSTNYLEVLTAERTLLNASLASVANQFSEIQSTINLYQSLGGGK